MPQFKTNVDYQLAKHHYQSHAEQKDVLLLF